MRGFKDFNADKSSKSRRSIDYHAYLGSICSSDA